MTLLEKLQLASKLLTDIKQDSALLGRGAQIDIIKAERDLRWILTEIEDGQEQRPELSEEAE